MAGDGGLALVDDGHFMHVKMFIISGFMRRCATAIVDKFVFPSLATRVCGSLEFLLQRHMFAHVQVYADGWMNTSLILDRCAGRQADR